MIAISSIDISSVEREQRQQTSGITRYPRLPLKDIEVTFYPSNLDLCQNDLLSFLQVN